MDYLGTIAAFKNGSALVDSVAANITTVTGLGTSMSSVSTKIPALGDAMAAITAMTDSVTAGQKAMLAKLPVALPAMKAMLVLDKKKEMADGGGMASLAPSAGFSAYFGSFDTIKDAVASATTAAQGVMASIVTSAGNIPGVAGSTAAAKFASLAAAMPPGRIPNPDAPGTDMVNPAYTSFMSTNGTAMGAIATNGGALGTLVASAGANVTAQFAAANASYADGMATLKASAFASFCSGSQPKAVSDVVAKLVVPTAIAPASTFVAAQNSGASWSTSQSRVTTVTQEKERPDLRQPETKPAATTYQPSGCTPAQKSEIAAQADAAFAAALAAKKAKDTARDGVDPWATANNWYAVRENKATSAEAKANYDRLWPELQALPAYTDFIEKQRVSNELAARYADLSKIKSHMWTTGPWPGNPDGPW